MKTPLHLAAEHDDPDETAALLARGAELEAQTSWGATPLRWAAVLGSSRAASVLLEHGAHCDLASAAGLGMPLDGFALEDVDEAFYLACRNGHRATAAWLLERGADVDARGYFGAPALHWAAINGHADTVRWLLGCGADPSLRDAEFDSDAAGWAAEGGFPELAAALR